MKKKRMDKLYKRTKTGAIQSYNIWVDDSTINKETGQLEGKKILHIEKILEGKNIGKANETTPEEQAILQAQSDWTRKYDDGYKSLEDLGAASEDELDALLPKFNSDASGNVKPMLAKTINWDKVIYPCLIQPKLDGVRCLMVVDFTDDGALISFLSRNGKGYTTLEHLIPPIEEYCESEGVSFILDGEIYSEELTFQEIIAAVKKQRPDSLKLKFRAYDIVNDNKQKDRWTNTVELVTAIDSPFVNLVQCVVATTEEDVKDWHNRWVGEGNEGAMIRLYDGIYGQGQRSSSLLKVKEFDDSEFRFISWQYGQRGIEDLIALCEGDNGQFRAKMIGTKEEKEKLDKRPILVDAKITIKYFGLTDDGLPRFPIGIGFRDYE